MRDQVVPLRRQVKLFEWIPGAEAFRVDGAHDSVVAEADQFVPQLGAGDRVGRGPDPLSPIEPGRQPIARPHR